MLLVVICIIFFLDHIGGCRGWKKGGALKSLVLTSHYVLGTGNMFLLSWILQFCFRNSILGATVETPQHTYGTYSVEQHYCSVVEHRV
jgi:hypothetical protein